MIRNFWIKIMEYELLKTKTEEMKYELGGNYIAGQLWLYTV